MPARLGSAGRPGRESGIYRIHRRLRKVGGATTPVRLPELLRPLGAPAGEARRHGETGCGHRAFRQYRTDHGSSPSLRSAARRNTGASRYPPERLILRTRDSGSMKGKIFKPSFLLVTAISATLLFENCSHAVIKSIGENDYSAQVIDPGFGMIFGTYQRDFISLFMTDGIEYEIVNLPGDGTAGGKIIYMVYPI